MTEVDILNKVSSSVALKVHKIVNFGEISRKLLLGVNKLPEKEKNLNFMNCNALCYMNHHTSRNIK